jgi:LmbE family N-acetylglucosaminyl deacetylase
MTGPRPRRILLLSPHPDDIAWSLGGLVARLRRTGAVMFAVTFFGRTAYAPGSPAHGSAAATQVRGIEEDTWAELAGVRADRGDLPDASLRGYDDDTEMGAEPDPEIVRATTERLRGALTLVRPHLTLAPLAVGGHVDHRAVRLAVGALLPRLSPGLLWYEDLPYAEVAGVAGVAAAKEAAGGTAGAGAGEGAPARHPMVIDVSADWRAKETGVRCFPSQLPQSVLPVLRRHAAAVAAREAGRRDTAPGGTAPLGTGQWPGPARAERLWAASLTAQQRLSVLANTAQVTDQGSQRPTSPAGTEHRR